MPIAGGVGHRGHKIQVPWLGYVEKMTSTASVEVRGSASRALNHDGHCDQLSELLNYKVCTFTTQTYVFYGKYYSQVT
jgi:hypothetical protein